MSRRFAHVISSLSCLAACRPLRSSARVSSRFASPCHLVARAVPWLLATRPASSTRRTGRYDGAAAVLSALLACPSARHLIRAFGIGWRRGSVPAHAPCPSSAPPANPIARPIRFTHRLIISSASLPDQSTRETGREPLGLGCLLVGSLAIAARLVLLSICAGSVEDGVGGCLACLPIVLCILSMGDGISATVRVRPLIAWTLLLTRFLLRPPLRRISGPGFFLHPFIARIACRFSFDAPRPVCLLNHGGRVEVFLCVLCAVSSIKRRWLVRCQFNRFGSDAHRFPHFPASVPLRVRRVPLPVCLLVLSMMSCRHRILCRLCPPHRGYTFRHPSIVFSLICLPFRLSYRFASLRPHAPLLVSSSGAMSYLRA